MGPLPEDVRWRLFFVHDRKDENGRYVWSSRQHRYFTTVISREPLYLGSLTPPTAERGNVTAVGGWLWPVRVSELTTQESEHTDVAVSVRLDCVQNTSSARTTKTTRHDAVDPFSPSVNFRVSEASGRSLILLVIAMRWCWCRELPCPHFRLSHRSHAQSVSYEAEAPEQAFQEMSVLAEAPDARLAAVDRSTSILCSFTAVFFYMRTT